MLSMLNRAQDLNFATHYSASEGIISTSPIAKISVHLKAATAPIMKVDPS